VICEAKNARDLACGQGDDQDPCPLGGASIACLIREEAVAPFAECLADCAEFEDSCADIAGEQISPAPSQAEYHVRCFDTLERCADTFIDDYCTQGDAFHLILRESVYVQWMTCFDLPCDEVNACLEASYGDEYSECVLAYL
jgi:hypothetical protein